MYDLVSDQQEIKSKVGWVASIMPVSFAHNVDWEDAEENTKRTTKRIDEVGYVSSTSVAGGEVDNIENTHKEGGRNVVVE